jgi:outer membrane immunogenic protein
MSKNILLCTVASVAVAASSAFAADMPVKAPLTPAPPAWSWAGFYIGAHGGYGWKRNDFAEVVSTTPLLTLGDINSNGWVAGGQFGTTGNMAAGSSALKWMAAPQGSAVTALSFATSAEASRSRTP